MTRKNGWHLAAVVLGGLLSMHCGATSPTGSGGAGGAGGSGAGGSGGLPPGGRNPPNLPTVKGTCPTLRNGSNTITVNGVSMRWTLNVGQRAANPTGPIIIYWHATGSNQGEVTSGFGQTAINEVVALGGVVASAESTTSTGANTGNNVWYRGDFNFADQIVACAIQQLNIDTRHIHTLGYSAGGLQSVAMGYDRSGYVAALASYSGGLLFPNNKQTADYLPPAMLMHGPQGSDVFIIDFFDTSNGLINDYRKTGDFAIDCPDSGGHVNFGRLTGAAPSVWRFFKAHPYGSKPSPWQGGLPSGFLNICRVASPQ